MQEDAFVSYHFPEAQGDAGGAAENERIYDSCIGGKLP